MCGVETREKTRLCSYRESGEIKATVNIVVPMRLVSRIIGEEERNIKDIVNKSRCVIKLADEVLPSTVLIDIDGQDASSVHERGTARETVLAGWHARTAARRVQAGP